MRIAVLALILALSSCADAARYANTAKTVAIQTIEGLNDTGFDPLQADRATLQRYATYCSIALSISTVIDPRVPSASDVVDDLCATILTALAPRDDVPPASVPLS